MRRILLVPTLLLLACASGTQAGSPDLEPQQLETVFRHSFNAPGPERARLRLEPGHYRIEVTYGGVQFALRPLQAGVQPPVVRELVPGRGVTGSRLLDAQVYAAAEYEIQVTGGEAGRSADVIVSRVVPEPAP